MLSDFSISMFKKLVPYFHTSKCVAVPTNLLNAFELPATPSPGTPGSVAVGYQVKLTELSFTMKKDVSGMGAGALTARSAAKAEPAQVMAAAHAMETDNALFPVDIQSPLSQQSQVPRTAAK